MSLDQIPPCPPDHDVPRFGRSEEARQLERLLGDLVRFSSHFYYAVKLFDACHPLVWEDRDHNDPAAVERSRDGSAWSRTAARDGAMAVFHFAKSLEALKGNVGRVKELEGRIDYEALRSARRAFDEYFPNFGPVRHAVAHSGELSNTPKSRARNALEGRHVGPGIDISGTGNFVTEMLVNRTFMNTYEGQLVTYDVSWENWLRLDGLLRQILSAFARD